MPRRPWIPIGLLLLSSAALPTPHLSQDNSQRAVVSTQDAQAECDALIEEVDKAERKWRADYRAAVKEAQENGDPIPAFKFNDSPVRGYVAEFQARADKYAGTDAAIPFLVWLAVEGTRSKVKIAKDAVETLCTVHGSSAAFADHVEGIGDWVGIVGKRRAAELLKELELNSGVPAVAGWAVYARLHSAFRKTAPGTEAFASMKAELISAAARANSPRLTALVQQQVRLQEVFGLGVVAPDIQGIDLDGVEFALSDYKGKVILLDFWGDW